MDIDDEEYTRDLKLKSKISMNIERWFLSTNAKDILRRGGTIWLQNKKLPGCVQNRYGLSRMALSNEVVSWVLVDRHSFINADKQSMNVMACWIPTSETWTWVNHHYKTGQLATCDGHYIHVGKMVAKSAYITDLGTHYLLIPEQVADLRNILETTPSKDRLNLKKREPRKRVIRTPRDILTNESSLTY